MLSNTYGFTNCKKTGREGVGEGGSGERKQEGKKGRKEKKIKQRNGSGKKTNKTGWNCREKEKRTWQVRGERQGRKRSMRPHALGAQRSQPPKHLARCLAHNRSLVGRPVRDLEGRGGGGGMGQRKGERCGKRVEFEREQVSKKGRETREKPRNEEEEKRSRQLFSS